MLVYLAERREGPNQQPQRNALDLTFIDDYAYAQHGPVIQKRRLARPAGVADLTRSAKMKHAFLLFLLALAVGCERKTDSPIGINKWEEVVALAGACFIHGDTEALLAHIDKVGLPADVGRRFDETIVAWKKSPNLRYSSTSVMTPGEYEALVKEEDKRMPKVFRRNPLPPLRWNIAPERLIIFTFVSNDPKDKTTQVRWLAGAFHRNNRWYFAACYP